MTVSDFDSKLFGAGDFSLNKACAAPNSFDIHPSIKVVLTIHNITLSAKHRYEAD